MWCWPFGWSDVTYPQQCLNIYIYWSWAHGYSHHHSHSHFPRLTSCSVPILSLANMSKSFTLIGWEWCYIVASDWSIYAIFCLWLVNIPCVMSLIDWSIYAVFCLWLVTISSILPLIGQYRPLIGCWGHVWAGDIGVMSVMSMWSHRDAKWDIALMIHTTSRQ